MRDNSISLWKIFGLKAKSENDSLDGEQIRDLLIMENNKKFDKIICMELVETFGSLFSDGIYGVDYEQFVELWQDLGKFRFIFDKYSENGILSNRDFWKILEIGLHQSIEKEFMKDLVKFYRGKITFDAFYHANQHLREMVENQSAVSSHSKFKLTFDDFHNQIFILKPSAPSIQEDLPPSYDEAMNSSY